MSCSSRWCKLEEKLFKVTRCCVVGRDVSVAKAANRRHQIGDASVPLGGPLRDRAVVVLDYWKQESGAVNTAVLLCRYIWCTNVVPGLHTAHRPN